MVTDWSTLKVVAKWKKKKNNNTKFSHNGEPRKRPPLSLFTRTRYALGRENIGRNHSAKVQTPPPPPLRNVQDPTRSVPDERLQRVSYLKPEEGDAARLLTEYGMGRLSMFTVSRVR